MGRRKLKEFLSSEDMSYVDMAYKMGCSAASICLWVNGKASPNSNMAMRMQKITKGAIRISDWGVFNRYSQETHKIIMYEIEGEPIPWKAHQGFGKRSYSVNTPAKNSAKWNLAIQHGNKPLYEKPLRVNFTFEMPIPKGSPKKFRQKIEQGDIVYHDKRPDRTNLQKFAEDCLNGSVICDDNIVVDGRSIKIYSINPRTTIEIEEI